MWQMWVLLLNCVIYSHFFVRNKLLSGATNCPLGFTEVIADFYYYFTTPFQVQKAEKLRIWPQVEHKYWRGEGFGCVTEGDIAENREVFNL